MAIAYIRCSPAVHTSTACALYAVARQADVPIGQRVDRRAARLSVPTLSLSPSPSSHIPISATESSSGRPITTTQKTTTERMKRSSTALSLPYRPCSRTAFVQPPFAARPSKTPIGCLASIFTPSERRTSS